MRNDPAEYPPTTVLTSTGSARGVLTTILGEFVLPAGGSAWTQTLVAALDLMGVRDKAARQTLARMEDAEWLTRRRHGRQTRWSLTSQATSLLRDGAERIYSFGQTDRRWDGRWMMLIASVPETDRSTRYRMAQQLTWAGFGTIGHGIWLSPWTDQEAGVAGLLGELGVAATSFRAEVGALGSPAELAAEAWDLPRLRTHYADFLESTPSPSQAAKSGGTAVADLTALVQRWRRFPFLDPELPADLLPDDWPARAAAHRFAEVRSSLSSPARIWWQTEEQRHTPPGWTAP